MRNIGDKVIIKINIGDKVIIVINYFHIICDFFQYLNNHYSMERVEKQHFGTIYTS